MCAFSLPCVPTSVKSMQLLPPTPDHSQVSSLTICANSSLSQQVSLVVGVGARGRGAAAPRSLQRAAPHRRCRYDTLTLNVYSVLGPCYLNGNDGGHVT